MAIILLITLTLVLTPLIVISSTAIIFKDRNNNAREILGHFKRNNGKDLTEMIHFHKNNKLIKYKI